MDLKKLAISDQFPYCVSPRRKVVSGFSFGLVVSLIVLSVVLFNASFKAPFLSPIFQGFNSSRVNNSTSSVVPWPFSFSSTTAFSSSPSSNTSVSGSIASDKVLQNSGSNSSVEVGNLVDKTHEVNPSVVNKKGDVLGSNAEGISLGKTNVSVVGKKGDVLGSGGQEKNLGKSHVGNFSEKVKNGSLTLVEGRTEEKTQFVTRSDIGKNANSTKSEGKGVFSGTTHVGNFLEEVSNVSFGGGDVVARKSVNEVSLNKSLDNIGSLGCSGKGVPCSPIEHQRISSEKKNINVSSNNDSQPLKSQKGFDGNCDIFDGRWARDMTKPYYPAGSCRLIDSDFDCHLNGRPDGGYLKWKWKPYGCDIPSFNATDFLERLRGKKLVFVGDSLNRNMWESLVCILRQSVRNKKRIHEISGKTEFKKKGFYSFRHEDYDCTVDFVSSPFLVRESYFNGRKGPLETLRLDLMDLTTSMYADADVVVFNTGHWWTHEKTARGENYYQEGNHVYPRLKVLEAYKKALTTWARWVDQNIDGSRTQVIFRGFSATHFRGGQWNSGGRCHKETEPIFNEKFLTNYPPKMKVLEDIVREMKTPLIYLNISRLTDFRKDGHPSIYRRPYKTVEEQIAAVQSQDCSHWCLPGVPDTWNELLYASLLQAGKGSWRS